MNAMTEFKDQFTLDGRLKPSNFKVTRQKVEAADALITAAQRGDRIAAGKLAEAFSTTDLPFNAAHLISAIVIPQFDAAERTWNQVAGVRTVDDFGPVRLQSLYASVTGSGVAQNGGLPGIPESAPYPHISVTGAEAFYSKLQKSGARFTWTWESNVNDVVGFFDQIPGELLNLALDTEEREVYEALVNGTTNELASQTLPDGTVTDPNAAISPEAIWAAILQLQNVTVNGRKVGRASGYNVVVAAGTGDFVNYALNRTILQVVDGSIVYGPGDRSALNNVTVVESEYVTGTNWYVLPKPGSLRRPVLELLRLRGYEQPELRVQANAGNYVGGGIVSPFEGDFEADEIAMRVRFVAGGVLWDDSYSVKSDGSGTA